MPESKTPLASVVQSLESGPRGEATYFSLRQEILSCSLAPGSLLTEALVMERYRVGKSTCRLALARLIQEGFVHSIPRQGYMVTPVTLTDVEEIFALRLLLEPAAARLAAGRTDVRALKRIDALARTNKASQNIGNRIGFFLDGNREFHMTVAVASGNQRLAQSIETLLDEMKRIVALGFVEHKHSPEFQHDHQELIAALDRGDADQAERVQIRHITTFRDMTLGNVMRSIRSQSESLPLMNVRGSTPVRRSRVVTSSTAP